MLDSISIEETNKIRVAIGLKPLPVLNGGPSFKPAKDEDDSSAEEDVGSTLESRQAKGYDNWKNLQREADAKAQREAKAEAIKKARDAARKFSKLEGKGLGEAGDDVDLDTKTWLLRQKKRQKKLDQERLKKLEKELAEREQQPEHTTHDLAGVRVGHEIGDFDVGGDHVLTLKDITIDQNEDEGDELENVEMKEQEALDERLQSRKKRPLYDPNDEDPAGNKSVLKHYDETIDGKKRKRFTLNGQGAGVEDRETIKNVVGERLKAQLLSLDNLEDTPASDYNVISEAQILKSKKKKAKSTRRKLVEKDEIFHASSEVAQEGDTMDTSPSATPHANSEVSTAYGMSFVDDDDLQAALAKQRREALKRRKMTKPEDIARQLREEASAPGPDDANDNPPEDGGLIIDETSEFVANLERASQTDKPLLGKTKKPNMSVRDNTPTPNDDADIDMDRRDGEEDFKENSSEALAPVAPNVPVTGLEEESTLNQGVGATFSMLSQRGLIGLSPQGDVTLDRDRERFLAQKRVKEAEAEQRARQQRERDRSSGKLDRMSARDREEYARWENKQRDQAESRQMAEIFNREYKPNVQLKYVDEFGRSMNQKEAFKHLSHQFHGKGSGKQKTEKHLKKIEDEKKREAISSLDSSQATGMNNAMGATAKKNRQAGVRLA